MKNSIGKIITFFPGSYSPVPKTPDIYAGKCEAYRELEPVGTPAIRNFEYTVRGLSGTVAVVTTLENHAMTWNNWGDALRYIKPRDPENKLLKRTLRLS